MTFVCLSLTDGRRIEIDRPIEIGRAKQCDLVLEDAAASRIHVRLVPGEGRVTVIDLGSCNGTFVDGRRVVRVEVESAIVRAGNHVFAVGRDQVAQFTPDPDSETLPSKLPRVPLELRRTEIEAVLRDCNGNVKRAARTLGIARGHFYRLLARWQLDPATFRAPAS